MNPQLITSHSFAFVIVFVPMTGAAAIQNVRRKTVSWRALGLAVAVFVAHAIVLALPQLAWFDELQYNWQGKFLVAMLTAAILTRCPAEFRTRAGFVLPNRHWMVYTGIATVALLLISAAQGLSLSTPKPLTVDTLLFQATVPGFDEELIYRGVLFALFGLAFGICTRSGGWLVLFITILLFGLVHAFEWQGDSIKFLAGPFMTASVVGFWLGWLRLYTGSVLPGIVLHNLYNVVFVVTASIGS